MPLLHLCSREEKDSMSGSDAATPMVDSKTGPPPMTGNEVPLYPELADEAIRNKFVVRGSKDGWCIVLYVLAVVGVVGWGIADLVIHHIVIGKYAGPSQLKQLATAATKYLILFSLAAIGVSGALCALVLALARYFPTKFIYTASAVVAFFLIGSLLSAGLTTSNFTLIGIYIVLHGGWLFWVRKYIPFTGELLKHSITTVTRHYGTILTGVGACLVLGVYGVILLLFFIPLETDMMTTGGPSQFLVSFVSLVGLWTVQLVMGVMQVTTCGTVATWYFSANMPPNPSVASLKRALTSSLGSLCFGSLMVSILTMIYSFFDNLSNQFAGNIFVQCLIAQVLKVLKYFMTFFNVYSYCYIAIYGLGMIEASSRVMKLLEDSGVEVLLKNSLLQSVLSFATIFNSITCGVFFSAVALAVLPSSNAALNEEVVAYRLSSISTKSPLSPTNFDSGSGSGSGSGGFGSESGNAAFVMAVAAQQDSFATFMAVFIAVMSGCICYAIHIVLLRVVYSGAVTILICFAETPETLATSNPEMYKKIFEAHEAMAGEIQCCCKKRKELPPLTAPRPEIACIAGIPLSSGGGVAIEIVECGTGKGAPPAKKKKLKVTDNDKQKLRVPSRSPQPRSLSAPRGRGRHESSSPNAPALEFEEAEEPPDTALQSPRRPKARSPAANPLGRSSPQAAAATAAGRFDGSNVTPPRPSGVRPARANSARFGTPPQGSRKR